MKCCNKLEPSYVLSVSLCLSLSLSLSSSLFLSLSLSLSVSLPFPLSLSPSLSGLLAGCHIGDGVRLWTRGSNRPRGRKGVSIQRCVCVFPPIHLPWNCLATLRSKRGFPQRWMMFCVMMILSLFPGRWTIAIFARHRGGFSNGRTIRYTEHFLRAVVWLYRFCEAEAKCMLKVYHDETTQMTQCTVRKCFRSFM